MRESDFREFSEILDATCKLVTRNAYTPDAQNAALFFRAMTAYSLPEVRGALDAHIRDPQRGRFAPTPSDLISHIALKGDGRPGPEEAWSIALKGQDEADTVVWTREIASAWIAARGVLDLGDEVGARMAFREVYERSVRVARESGAKVEWQAMLGHDSSRHEAALQQAVAAGLLSRPDVLQLGYDVDAPRSHAVIPPEVAEHLAGIRDRLARPRAPAKADARNAGSLGQFRSIPQDALPPGMREERQA